MAQTTDSPLAAEYVAAARKTLGDSLCKIKHCLDQLDDSHMGWRPFPQQNSLTNIILHLCGNMRQWLIAGVSQTPDTRDRPAEFSEQTALSKQELLKRLTDVIAEADRTIAGLSAAQLIEKRRIQGFETTVLDAIFNSVSHLVGHTHQIVYITRGHLKEKYKFQWAPHGAEQGETAK